MSTQQTDKSTSAISPMFRFWQPDASIRARRGGGGEQARRRAPSMAASLDPATQAGIGAFAGLVEVTAQQVRRAACLQRKSSSLRLGTNPEPALSLSARRAFSRHRSRCARRRARVHDERDVLRYASRRATSSRVRVGPWGRPLTVPSPPKKIANEKRKHSPCTR